jgi:hypothetical protein
MSTSLNFPLFTGLASTVGSLEADITARTSGVEALTTEELLLLQRDVAVWSLFTSEVSTILGQFRQALQNVLQNVGR